MKKVKKELYDPTPAGEPFMGDLAYGRGLGKQGAGRGDFPADRDINGIPKNKEIIPLVLVRKKDKEF